MRKAFVWGGILLMASMWCLFGYSLATDHYKPLLEKAQGELAITQAQLAQAKSELATFRGILKTLVEGGPSKEHLTFIGPSKED
jgi:hypothetical protein